ncbi:MAG: 1-deoxy-D-xylulose-5-phosphate reductoisomerase [Pseudomonadota bacterium]
MRKTVTILGSTGTIGQNTLKCIKLHPEKFSLKALVARDNVELLAKQTKEFKPQLAVIANPAFYQELKSLLSGTGVEITCGEEAVIEAASLDADITMSAIVGAAGLKPTLAAIKNGKIIALANKESLVCAGELVQRAVEKHGATIIPVDSEHNAIFQLLQCHHSQQPSFSPHPSPLPRGEGISGVERVTITASGGPFRTFTLEQMQDVSVEQAIRHPNWNMGAKISVDSATMMNKGLELIEAYYLFPLKLEQLHILVHPQSIIHALVEMVDGSVLAQMSLPDMCTPIANALAYPDRIAAPVNKLRLEDIGNLNFEAPDSNRFPAISLARSALHSGGCAPTILNAANEIAVDNFLKGRIGFLDIAKTVEKTLDVSYTGSLDTINDVLECDAFARRNASELNK